MAHKKVRRPEGGTRGAAAAGIAAGRDSSCHNKQVRLTSKAPSVVPAPLDVSAEIVAVGACLRAALDPALSEAERSEFLDLAQLMQHNVDAVQERELQRER